MIRFSVRDRDIIQTVRIDSDKAFVGRSASNTIVLHDPFASRKHCMLRIRDGTVEILDLNSRHGLRVNGQPLLRAWLRQGDRVEIGSAELRLEEVEGERPALEGFGGYLDDEAHLYAIRGEPRAAPEQERATGEVAVTAATGADVAPKDGSPAGQRPLRERSFAEDLYRTLRRMPAWGLSVAAHLLLWMLILQIPWASPDDDEALPGVVAGNTEGYSPLENEVPAMTEGLPEEEPDSRLETPMVPEAIDDLPTDAPEGTAEGPDAIEPDLAPLITPHEDAFRMKVQGLASRSKVQMGPNERFGAGQAGDVNRRVSGFVLESIGGAQGRLAQLLRRRPQGETIVVRGTYDRVETVLDMFHVPHTRVELRDLANLDLQGVRAIFVNCSNEAFPDETVEKVAAFVKAGGYLFTTDWAIENVIERAFPRTIAPVRAQGQVRGTADSVVEIEGRTRHHFLLEGTGLEETSAEWWLEDSSYPIKVIRTDIVDILVSSKELRRTYGSGAVAVTFQWGSGRVVHVMGHYYQKKGNLRGAFAMQKIITNFLIAAIRKR